jgi:hypothetical protein
MKRMSTKQILSCVKHIIIQEPLSVGAKDNDQSFCTLGKCQLRGFAPDAGFGHGLRNRVCEMETAKVDVEKKGGGAYIRLYITVVLCWFFLFDVTFFFFFWLLILKL